MIINSTTMVLQHSFISVSGGQRSLTDYIQESNCLDEAKKEYDHGAIRVALHAKDCKNWTWEW